MKALDLFCCAGGASMGLYQAGFEVTGVDIVHHKNYPFTFIQGDVMQLDIEFIRRFDLIWASPPCQAYSRSTKEWRKKGYTYPDLIEPVRCLLISSGNPFIIENVEEAPLINPIILCGSMFGLRTYRHRKFESNFKINQPEHPKHINKCAKMGRYPKDDEFMTIAGHITGVKLANSIMGVGWMNQAEIGEAIPPVYSKYIAEQFMKREV